MNSNKSKLLRSDFDFCYPCSRNILQKWKGWPMKDKTPMLPLLQQGKCPICGESNPISSTKIAWVNVHGEFSTGLPDFWKIVIEDGVTSYGWYITQWGYPYFDKKDCPICGAVLIISQHKVRQSEEYLWQCTVCDYSKQERMESNDIRP